MCSPSKFSSRGAMVVRNYDMRFSNPISHELTRHRGTFVLVAPVFRHYGKTQPPFVMQPALKLFTARYCRGLQVQEVD